jgi:hypothetical protein
MPPNIFITEKNKAVQIFKLYLSYISFIFPVVQIYTSSSDCKCVGKIPGSHFVKAFSALPSHS